MSPLQYLAKTDRKAFNDMRRLFQQQTRKQPTILTEVPISDELKATTDHPPVRAWRSREFAVFEYHEGEHVRITVNRSEVDNQGNWKDGISWDDLMRVKREIGLGDVTAVEILPADGDVVDVANMRHFWLVDYLPFGWKKAEIEC